MPATQSTSLTVLYHHVIRVAEKERMAQRVAAAPLDRNMRWYEKGTSSYRIQSVHGVCWYPYM